MKKLFGVITAMTTPFDSEHRVDYEAIKEQVEFLISKGVNCLYPCGTTGEMYFLSDEERERIAETVVRQAAKRVTVFIHTGAMSLDSVIRLSRHAYKIGADGIGVVTPSYFGCSDEVLFRYYVEICGALPNDFSVYTYVIPQLAKNDISVSLMEKIAGACPQVVGVKYSYPDFRRISQYLTVRDCDFSVVVGSDDFFFPALVMGCDGTVSGCSGPMPEAFVAVYKYFLKGDYDRARRAQFITNQHCQFLKYGGDLSIFKNILTLRGVPGGAVRRPLLDLSAAEVADLKIQLDKFLMNNDVVFQERREAN